MIISNTCSLIIKIYIILFAQVISDFSPPRSVWHHPLRLDNKLYIEVVFNQIAPDYLEGLLLVMPSEQIDQELVYQVAKVASLLHRAADMDHVPTLKETKFLLPKPALSARDIKPPQVIFASHWPIY